MALPDQIHYCVITTQTDRELNIDCLSYDIKQPIFSFHPICYHSVFIILLYLLPLQLQIWAEDQPHSSLHGSSAIHILYMYTVCAIIAREMYKALIWGEPERGLYSSSCCKN